MTREKGEHRRSMVGWLGWLRFSNMHVYHVFLFLFSTYADTPEMRMKLGWDVGMGGTKSGMSWLGKPRADLRSVLLLCQRCIAVDSIRLLDLGRQAPALTRAKMGDIQGDGRFRVGYIDGPGGMGWVGLDGINESWLLRYNTRFNNNFGLSLSFCRKDPE